MSTLVVSNINDGTTTVPATYVTNGSAKAWVNFNGTGTIAARDSLNLSSLTDNGAGNYTVSFSNAMANENYSTGGGASRSPTDLLGGIQFHNNDGTTSTSGFAIKTYNYGASAFDYPYIGAQNFGDLA